jgi:hypothetical protein
LLGKRVLGVIGAGPALSATWGKGCSTRPGLYSARKVHEDIIPRIARSALLFFTGGRIGEAGE